MEFLDADLCRLGYGRTGEHLDHAATSGSGTDRDWTGANRRSTPDPNRDPTLDSILVRGGDVEQNLAKLIQGLPQGAILLDGEGRFVAMNPHAKKLTGTQDGGTAAQMLCGEKKDCPSREVEIQTQNGTRTILVDRIHIPMDLDESSPDRWTILYLTDLTSLKTIQHNLQELEERYTLVIQGVNDGLWDWDLKKNKVFYSSRWKYMLGYGEKEILPEPNAWMDLIHPDERKQVGKEINQHLKGNSPYLECEYRILHKDGSYRWVLCRGLAIRDNEGRAYRMAGSLSDITSRKLAEEQLRYKAFYDQLTELPNRVLLQEKILSALQRSKRVEEYQFAVLYMDLDRFKIINDSLGHNTGDLLLKQIARRMEKVIRSSDTFSRIGGDEFVLLLDPTKSQQDAILVADRIQREFQKPFRVDGKELFTTTSIGIVLSSPEYHNPEDLLRDADNAMYRAKEKGQAQWEIFHTEMYSSTVEQFQTETLFRKAVENHQFLVQFQPIVDLKKETITAAEALVRWEKSDGELVDTKAFLTLAEETGLIHDIDQWMLERVCMFLASLRLKKITDLRICANLSLVELKNQHLIPWIQHNLQKYQSPASLIDLEFKESILFSEAREDMDVLRQLHHLGIGISLDDYGSGSAQFAFLKDFPLRRIKIHQSLIQGLEENGGSSTIVKAIITMAHNLGKVVVAVGVETPAQLEFLKTLHCDEAQGYYLHKPMPFKELLKILKQ